jgi:hypothetical protein
MRPMAQEMVQIMVPSRDKSNMVRGWPMRASTSSVRAMVAWKWGRRREEGKGHDSESQLQGGYLDKVQSEIKPGD